MLFFLTKSQNMDIIYNKWKNMGGVMYSKVFTAVNWGIEGQCVEIETNIVRGLPNHIIVGLPSTIVMESKERVKTALKTTNMRFPDDRIVQNLFPASIRKEGAHLDLPIAVGIMASVLEISNEYIQSFGFLGELSLDGKLKRVQGILSLIEGLKKMGIFKIVIPMENFKEASYVDDVKFFPYEDFQALLEDTKLLNIIEGINQEPHITDLPSFEYDYNEVIGQHAALRAVEVAITGFHNLLIIGPPGCGKSMIAQRLVTIMPEMTLSEKIELTKVYGISLGDHNDGLIHLRPFRSPHHTISRVGLVGGGSTLYPGEISKAHKGVLYLDEIAEFKSDVLEALREPLTTQRVHLTKGGKSLTYPASFMLVATMNPCPCGNYLSKDEMCMCSHFEIKRYFNKLSGPMLDRIDMTLFVDRVQNTDIHEHQVQSGKSSKEIKETIERALAFRKMRENRSMDQDGKVTYGQKQSHEDIKKDLSDEAHKLLNQYHEKGKLTMRSYQKIMMLSRTIADLDGTETISKKHILEAYSYQTSNQIKRFLS